MILRHLIILSITSFIWTSCNQKEITRETTEGINYIRLSEKQIKENNIETGKITMLPVMKSVKATGYIDVPPNNRVAYFIPVSAYVEDVKVLPGDKVRKGETLLVLSHPDIIELQSKYLQVRLKLDRLEKELQRKENLSGSAIVSEKETLQLRTDYMISKAELSSMATRLKTLGISLSKLEGGALSEKIYITSKTEGRISALNVHNGKLINPEENLLTVINTEHKHLEINLFAEAAILVKIGQKVNFTTSGSEKKYEGQVYLKNANFDDDNTLLAHCHVDDSDEDLIVGNFAYVNVVLSQDSVLAMPNEEIISTTNKFFIFTQTEKGFERKEIFIGKRDDQYSEIIGPVDILSQPIVTKGNYYLNGI